MFKKSLNMRKVVAIAIYLAGVTMFLGCDKDGSNNSSSSSSSSSAEPTISFVARNPVTESLYSNTGFFQGSRINFNLVVSDAAGMKSITISKEATGAPNGNRKTVTQTRIIPISGTGTYPLSQEILRSSIYGDIYSQFTYTVSAHGKNYTCNYRGDYSAYNGSWSHYFVIK